MAMDGREIHFSSSRAGTLDFSWTTKGNHVVKVICYAAAPLSATPGFRQYDLLIDGQSFFTMPKLFQIGINDPNAGRGARAYGGYANPPNAISPVSLDSGYPGASAQEEADLRRAIQASLEESRRHLEKGSSSNGNGNAPPPRGQSMDGDLLGFDSPPPSMGGPPSYAPGSDAPSVSGMSYYSAPPSYSQQPAYGSPPPYQMPPQTPVGPGALVPMHGPPGSGYYQAPPPPTTPAYGSPPPGPPPPTPASGQSYYGAPPPQNYAGAPPPQAAPFGFNTSSPYEDPFAPKPPPPPPVPDLTTLVMGAYQSGPTPTTPMASGGPPGNQNGWPYSPQENGGGPPPGMSMSTLAITEQEEAPVDALTKAMRNLVNFDHIDEPAEGELKLTMVKKEEAKKKIAKGKSTPLPPVGSTLVGTGASLSQIKQVQHGVSRTTVLKLVVLQKYGLLSGFLTLFFNFSGTYVEAFHGRCHDGPSSWCLRSRSQYRRPRRVRARATTPPPATRFWTWSSFAEWRILSATTIPAHGISTTTTVSLGHLLD